MAYDVIVVGGGIAGSALATVLASRGIEVLILERERVFKDRVRGEGIHPWGVAEARALGLLPTMLTCGREVRYWTTSFGAPPGDRRDLILTTLHQAGTLTFYHPQMQETLLQAAAAAGAAVQRGATVINVQPGHPATVQAEMDGQVETLRANLVVAADGRLARSRAWGGFTVQRRPHPLSMAGVLLEKVQAPEESVHVLFYPPRARAALLFPLGRQRFRTYVVYPTETSPVSLGGHRNLTHFLAVCQEIGVPAAWFDGARLGGPMAAFDCTEVWVEHPHAPGLVLIGDAATAPNPIWGCGLSLVLRDVRTLAEALLSQSNWRQAGHTYALAHDRYRQALQAAEEVLTRLLFEMHTGEDGLRMKIAPRQVLGPARRLDIVGLGPDAAQGLSILSH
jgi:2-polyprenyl-6-methoxyphenol hydroxylase-like FAD-dependent oxidoreductase